VGRGLLSGRILLVGRRVIEDVRRNVPSAQPSPHDPAGFDERPHAAGHERRCTDHRVLGTIAQSYGATIKDTLHHRGEHETGAVRGPDDNDVYVPRALWTESYDSPMKHTHRAFDSKTFVGDELKRIAEASRKKDYYRKVVDKQLEKGGVLRGTLRTDKKEFAALVDADIARHTQDLHREKELKVESRQRFKEELDKQCVEQMQRAKDNLKQDEAEAALVKVSTMKHLAQEMDKASRIRKNAQREMHAGMQENEVRRLERRAARERENDEVRAAIRQQLEKDEFRLEAQQVRLQGAQKQQNFNYKVYERTAGKENANRARAEENRLTRDERMHMLRTDTYYAAREHARERQRQSMVMELDKHAAANERQKEIQKLVKEAEKEAVVASTKMALDAEMEKMRRKKAEELQLQSELLKMIDQRDKQEKADGVTRPLNASTMSFSKSGGLPAELANRVDASRYISKPLGRPERVASDVTAMRRHLEKSQSAPAHDAHASNPKKIGGVVGVFSGNGGPTAIALSATGGQEHFMRKATGMAVRDRKLSSSWNEGLRPQELRAARKIAAQREAEKALANRD